MDFLSYIELMCWHLDIVVDDLWRRRGPWTCSSLTAATPAAVSTSGPVTIPSIPAIPLRRVRFGARPVSGRRPGRSATHSPIPLTYCIREVRNLGLLPLPVSVAFPFPWILFPFAPGPRRLGIYVKRAGLVIPVEQLWVHVRSIVLASLSAHPVSISSISQYTLFWH